jgi:hypothetical protein
MQRFRAFVRSWCYHDELSFRRLFLTGRPSFRTRATLQTEDGTWLGALDFSHFLPAQMTLDKGTVRYLFPKEPQKPMENFVDSFLYLELSKLTFQVIRRTIATLAQKKGTVKDVQGLLRHSRAATTTDVYMQEISESVQATVNAVNAELRVKRKEIQAAD